MRSQKQMEREVASITKTFINLLVNYNYGFEVYKNRGLVFVDRETGQRLLVEEDVLNEVYKEMEE